MKRSAGRKKAKAARWPFGPPPGAFVRVYVANSHIALMESFTAGRWHRGRKHDESYGRPGRRSRGCHHSATNWDPSKLIGDSPMNVGIRRRTNCDWDRILWAVRGQLLYQYGKNLNSPPRFVEVRVWRV